MRTDKYKLEGKTIIPCHDLMEWARWMEDANRHVRVEKKGDVRVSTVFLGLDHSFDDGPPLLFETMIFGGPHDGFQERCSTWEEAEKQHQNASELAFKTAQRGE